MEQETIIEQPAGSVNDPGRKPQRLLALDVFRGITIFLMIIVNTPGKGAPIYSYLIHAKWFGFTLADLVFPSFLFAGGIAMSYSMKSTMQLEGREFLLKISQRTILIFLLGYLLYWFPFFHILSDGSWTVKPISETRIMGVLQRIAICYFFASMIIRYVTLPAAIIMSVAALLLYWGVLYVFGDFNAELSIAGNAIVKLDIFLLGERHVYHRDVVPFDPEGILSTLPAIVNVLVGYWAGLMIGREGKSYKGIAQLFVTGSILVAVGLCWGLVFPISKKLWTSSFVFYTSGIDILVVSVLIYLIEIRRWHYGSNFFALLGKNSLIIYLFSELFYITLMLVKTPSGHPVFEWVSVTIFQSVAPGHIGSFVTALVFTISCWLVAWVLDKKNIYVRL